MTKLATMPERNTMQPGDRVRVCSSVVVYTHPTHRGSAFDLEGQEGEVLQVLNDWKGRPISPTLPVVVAFGKFRAHFRDDEITRI
jgi:hypothetical protein